MIKITTILFLFSISTQAAEMPLTTTITQVGPRADGSFSIRVANPTTTCPGNINDQQFFFKVGQSSLTEEGFKNMYALAMAAQLTESQVYIVFDNSTLNCYVNRIWIR